jgi:AraC-type DNA-binding domain-containing proteins
MKSSLNANKNLLVKQIRNLHHAERQVLCTKENNRVRASIPEMIAYPANGTAANAGKRKKTKLCIKNMVSTCCKMVVKAVLENLGLNYSTVELGEVEIIGNISKAKHALLRSDLLKFGMVLLEDSKSILVEQTKKVIIEMIHNSDELPNLKNSYYVSEKLNHSYAYLANLFSEVTGMSIQHFIILHKIERAKELMVYDKLTLSEIASKLHYSSVAHLSLQFKKITGLSPTHFKNMKHQRLVALDEL